MPEPQRIKNEIIKIVFSFISLFWTNGNSVIADDLGLLNSVPRVLQNIRPFDTISFRYFLEETKDGVTWIKLLRREVKLDTHSGLFMITEVSADNPQQGTLSFNQFSNLGGKMTIFGGKIKEDSAFSLQPATVIDAFARLSNSSTSFLGNDPVLWFYYDANESVRVSNIMFDKTLRDSISIQETANKDEIAMEFDTYTFIIDKKLGVISKKVLRVVERGGKT